MLVNSRGFYCCISSFTSGTIQNQPMPIARTLAGRREESIMLAGRYVNRQLGEFRGRFLHQRGRGLRLIYNRQRGLLVSLHCSRDNVDNLLTFGCIFKTHG